MEPKRLLEDHDDGFGVRLLRSARRDEAPSGSRARAAVALGLVSSGALATAVARGAAGAKTLTGTLIAKWFGVGILAGTVVTGSLGYVASATRPSTRVTVAGERVHARASTGMPTPHLEGPRSPLVPEAAEPAPVTESDSTTSAVVAPSPGGTPGASPALAAAAGATRMTPGPVAASAPVPLPSSSLAEELAILEHARRDLVEHDAAAVLRELERYAGARRTGVLDLEADVLRVEAYLQQGNDFRAVELAKRVLAKAPASPHATRLRRIIDGK